MTLSLVFDRENAVADGKALPHRKIHQGSRRLVRHDLEMMGFSADHASKRDNAVIGRATPPRGVHRNTDGGGNFQSPRYAHAVMACTRIIEHARRAAQKLV